MRHVPLVRRDHRNRFPHPRRSRAKVACRPRLEALEQRLNLSTVVIGSSPGSPPVVRLLDEAGKTLRSFMAFTPSYRGGVNVAVGDVNGDGVADIITGREQGPAVIRVFDGKTFTLIRAFHAFRPAYRGGVRVAYGHFGEKTGAIIAGTAHGAAVVKVFDVPSYKPVTQFQAFGPGTDGVQVAVGNLDAEPGAEIIVAPGPGGVPVIRGFGPTTGRRVHQIRVEPGNYRGGVELTSGDFNNDGVLDVATAASTGGLGMVRLWTQGRTGPVVLKKFRAFDPARTSGVTLGTLDKHTTEPDRIIAAPGDGTSRAARVLDHRGGVLDTMSLPRAGTHRYDLAGASDDYVKPYDGPKNIHAVDYSPTWPYWTSNPPKGVAPDLTVTTRVDDTTIQYRTVTGGIPWSPELLNNQSLFLSTPVTFFYILSSTFTPDNPANPGAGTGTITIGQTPSGYPDNPSVATTFPTDIQGKTLTLLTNQLFDSDLYNSTYNELWSTPRYTDSQGRKRTDLQVMQDMGVNTIRLYDWDPQRGFDKSGDGTSEHLAFLDALRQGGRNLQVIVPISNYNLTNDVWGATVPDDQYSYAKGPTAQLEYFIRSVTTNSKLSGGKLHPAVFGFEVGNEIDLDAGGDTGESMTVALKRALWWVVNLQRKLSDLGLAKLSDPNRPRFTIPVSHADQANASKSQTSWFQVFRDGAKAGDYTPFRGAARADNRFSTRVPGLAEVKGQDWYAAWFINSYQTFTRGGELKQVMELYAKGGEKGQNVPWHDRWPGRAFEVPLLFTELGWSIAEAGSEDAFVKAVTDDQMLVAERFLRDQIQQRDAKPDFNQSFIGYAFFEFNQEPNKNNILSGPDSEQTRGIFKYYPTADKDIQHWKTGDVIKRVQSPLSTFPYLDYQLHWVNYPVYTLYSVAMNNGKRLVDRLTEIFTGPLSG
jgi:hypothetical protein